MVSHKHSCIFIHIPKTAGTSIENKLGLFDEPGRGVQDHRSIRHIEPWSLDHLRYLPESKTLKTVMERFIHMYKYGSPLPKSKFQSYFKFSFVRNTWSRVHSWYKNVMRDKVLRERLSIHSKCNLKEFLVSHGDTKHLNSQFYWIEGVDGNIKMDFVGRFEEIERDFKKVSKELDLRDCSLPKLLHTDNSRRHYRDEYDIESKKIVESRYKREINYFEFEF